MRTCLYDGCLQKKNVAQEMSHHCCVPVYVVLCSHCCHLRWHTPKTYLVYHSVVAKRISYIKSNTSTPIVYVRDNGRRRGGGLMRGKGSRVQFLETDEKFGMLDDKWTYHQKDNIHTTMTSSSPCWYHSKATGTLGGCARKLV